jgi:16S rRNA (adenine1518-N6/adenine1519-N6)-dimethyltransferase
MRAAVMKKRRGGVESSSALPRAKKSLGQNFLVDERVTERIVSAFAPREHETVIEIGPGRGALTSHLIERAGRLVAVEFDRYLVPLLEEKFGARDNFALIQADALLMLQREVVERITAPPASSERGYLSVLVEAYCETETLFDVAPGSFHPQPKVWSTVVRLRLRERMKVEVSDEQLLWRIVSTGFAQRRKTILNNLRHAPEELRERIERGGGTKLVLETAAIEESRRAETLSQQEWAQLSRVIEKT